MPPIYNWKCLNPNCQADFEYFHVNSDDKAVCPKCSSKDAEKKISTGTSHQLKGGGWYSDGYSGRRKR